MDSQLLDEIMESYANNKTRSKRFLNNFDSTEALKEGVFSMARHYNHRTQKFLVHFLRDASLDASLDDLPWNQVEPFKPVTQEGGGDPMWYSILLCYIGQVCP